ncbi:ATP-binding protein [Chloroflexi bacterium TSY]|nr:ATP-binding protein [Chloroflexi bacterium TSY]
MTDPKEYLFTLKQNLTILQEQEAQYSDRPPIELSNQIEDHKVAIDQTRLVITGEVSQQQWEDSLRPLLASLEKTRAIVDQQNQQVGTQYNVAGDVQGDAVINNYHYHFADPPTTTDPALLEEALPCPYRSLFHFGPKDAEFFFGREDVIQELVRLAHRQSVVAVLGASGSGKSSVVLAGLVPTLQQIGNWQFTHFRPGADPFLSLASALVPLYEPDLGRLEQRKHARKLKREFLAGELNLTDLFDIIHEVHPQHRTLLIADQFEELFTLCPDEETRSHFLAMLTAGCQPIANPKSPAVIVLTMRADFLGQALEHPTFAGILEQDIKLRPMTQEELAQAVEMPAQKLHVSFEQGLVDRILKAIENRPGNLPLLEFALTLLWEAHGGEQLTHADYEAIGQVEGALAQYANNYYDRLTEIEQQKIQTVFTQMIRPGQGTEDTRRLATQRELGEENWALVRKLADARLVVTSRNADGQETVEVVHEALIQHWGKLDEWLNKVRAFRVWQEQLRSDMYRWQDVNEDNGALLRGALLADAERWLAEYEDNLTSDEVNFVQASVEHRELERQRFVDRFDQSLRQIETSIENVDTILEEIRANEYGVSVVPFQTRIENSDRILEQIIANLRSLG